MILSFAVITRLSRRILSDDCVHDDERSVINDGLAKCPPN